MAAHRALESESPNAAFRDPLAEVLVGERGRALRRSMPGSNLMHWIIVLRTVAIDGLILDAVGRGADTIVNIGAGLDTRPYRLQLPPQLRWIEIDLPSIIDLKEARLSSQTPLCQLERLAVDITNHEQRARALAQITAPSRSAAVLSEGLLPYLEPSEVASLSAELHRHPAIKFWIQDYYSGNLRDSPPRAWRKRLAAAPFKFQVPDWIGFFRTRGWHVLERIRLVDQARQLARPPPLPQWRMLMLALTPPAFRRQRQERAAYVMFEPRRPC